MDIKTWSDDIANLAADALIDGDCISKENFERAVSIISEEIFVRLLLGDYPPPEVTNDHSSKTDAQPQEKNRTRFTESAVPFVKRLIAQNRELFEMLAQR